MILLNQSVQGLDWITVLATALRICDQLEEVLPDFDPDLRVLHRLGVHENVTTGGQDTMFKKTNHSEVPKADNNWDYKGQKSLRDYCSANVPGEGSFTCSPPPPLQAVANDTSKSTAPGSVLPGQGDINHGYNPGMGELSGGR